MAGPITGRKQENIVKRNFSSLSAEKKSSAIADLLHRLNSTVTCITQNGYNKEGSVLLTATLKHFKINETEKSRFNMYCVIRRNKEKIQKYMTETAEPVTNDDKRGDGKKSEFEVQYLSNVSTAPASVEVVPDNQSILRAKDGSSTGTEHRDGKCVLVLTDDDENVCEDEIIYNDGRTESEDIPITITFPLIPQKSTETKIETVISYKKYCQCHLYIGRFEIEAEMWRTMLDDNGKMITTIYPQVLSESFYPIT